MVEAEDLIVIGMGKLMQNDIGVLGPGAPGEKTARSRDVNAFFERRIMPVGRKPLFGRVVLHVGQLVLDVDPDGQFAQGLGFFGRKNEDDSLEVVGHRLPDAAQEFALFGSFEGGVELDRPPFDFFDDWLGELGQGIGAVTLRMSKATQGQEQNERGTGTFHLGSIDFGYGKGAGEYDLIVDFDQNGIVALILELEPVDVVDQIDPVMGAGGFESPVDYDPRVFLGHGQAD